MDVQTILTNLKEISDPSRLEHMSKFGIITTDALGISIPKLRAIAKDIPKNHELALALWNTGIHEARILACYIDEITAVTPAQLEEWVLDFNSWDLCDQCCSNHVDKTPYAHQKAIEWSHRSEEFVKRAGFVLMATLSVHDKTATDTDFDCFFDRIIAECNDNRVYVKKAVNWALRQIGKRNKKLHKKAVEIGLEILRKDTKTARWIARDALRELRSEKIQRRLDRISK